MKQLYALYMNGKPYGKGNYFYMEELMRNWVDTNGMYGADEVEFTIKKLKYDKEGKYI